LATAAEEEIRFDRDFDLMSSQRCIAMVKSIQKSWEAESVRRIKQAVMQAAPHQLELYVRKDP
jgi:hypothetical protein